MRQPASSDMVLPELVTERLTLRHARPGDEAQVLSFFQRNQAHFERWSPPAPGNFYTVPYWSKTLAVYAEDFASDRAVRFNIHEGHAVDSPIAGRVGFTQVFRGAFQSCMVGYQIDNVCEGRGLMSEAMRAAIEYMFVQRNLHRIQANTLPENVRSRQLLRACGFLEEGLARDYLLIDGKWRDHVMHARINPVFAAIAIS
jgi:[ribosomal protein S5]-alanine N-acetyltransferase